MKHVAPAHAVFENWAACITPDDLPVWRKCSSPIYSLRRQRLGRQVVPRHIRCRYLCTSAAFRYDTALRWI